MLLETFQLLVFSPLMILGAGDVRRQSVTYRPEILCALEGSTVVMSGIYTHPGDITVEKQFWVIDPVKGKENADLREETDYLGRVTHLQDKPKHLSLRLEDVKKSDEHMYCIRVIGSRNFLYLYHPGIILKVTGLRVEAPETVMEGNKTVLVCSATCSLSETPAFIWYKDNTRIDEKSVSGNALILQHTKADDAGSYSCAARDYNVRSPAQRLVVKYQPRNVSVSVSPSADVVEGGSLNLTCRCDANPPVEMYEWFKMKTVMIKEKIYSISEIRSEDSGEYKCKCTNQHGFRYSGAVAVNVLYPPKNVSVSISPSGEIMEGSSVNLTCSSDANPPVENYTWFKGDLFVGKEKTFTISRSRSEDSGEYKCKCENTVGHRYSTNEILQIATIRQSKEHPVVLTAVIIMALAGLSLIIIVLLRKKRMFCWSEEHTVTDDAVTPRSAASDEGHYASIPHPEKAVQDAADHGLYANVQRRHHHHHHQEEEIQYSVVNFSSTNRSVSAHGEDSSVIYSSVK